jgi:hypothetical protein
MSTNKHLAALARQQSRRDLCRLLWERKQPSARRMFWREVQSKLQAQPKGKVTL